ncbi:hypothetical protein [Aeromonas sp. s9]|uniref:hypothetical protein n=1 Tax=Aeromonas sp. s9 TaxID=3138490 RepID=UPI0034A3A298
MISAKKILQIHRCIARWLEKEPPTKFHMRRVVQILDWVSLLVTQDQIREGYEPCVFSRAAELFYLITSERPFRHNNVLTALCAAEWWLRRNGVDLEDLSLDDLQVLTEKVNDDYRGSLFSACNDFAMDYRFWFAMHSKPKSDHSIGINDTIRSMSLTFAEIN